MSMIDQTASAARIRSRQAEEREYRWLLRIGFVVFLVAIALRRIMPWTWGTAAAQDRRLSIVSEAREAALTTIPFAFMG